MREPLRDRERLEHILAAIDRVARYTSGKTYDDLVADDMMYYAVVKNIEIIGEAANLLTKEFRDDHPEVPWRDIVDMRNVLVHGYYTTSPLFIWETYTKDLPVLLQQVEQYIKEIG
jgi:uncharacterized protein with HEPN domain